MLHRVKGFYKFKTNVFKSRPGESGTDIYVCVYVCCEKGSDGFLKKFNPVPGSLLIQSLCMIHVLYRLNMLYNLIEKYPFVVIILVGEKLKK